MREDDDITNYLPSLLNPRLVKYDTSLTQRLIPQQSTVSTSLSLRRKHGTNNNKGGNNSNGTSFISKPGNEIVNDKNILSRDVTKRTTIEEGSLGLSALDDFQEARCLNFDLNLHISSSINNVISNNSDIDSLKSKFPATTFIANGVKTKNKIDFDDRPTVSLAFCITNCDTLVINSNKSNVKRIDFKHKNNCIDVECELIEGSQLSEVTSDSNTEMNEPLFSPQKRKAVTVNLEIKKQRLNATDKNPQSKVLFLNTNAIDKLSHVIVQPLNYNFLKRRIFSDSKLVEKKQKSIVPHNKNNKCNKLKQVSLDKYFQCGTPLKFLKSGYYTKKVLQDECQVIKDEVGIQEMIKNIVNCNATENKLNKNCTNNDNHSQFLKIGAPRQEIGHSLSEDKGVLCSRSKKSSLGSNSPKRNVDLIKFNLPLKSHSNRASAVTKSVPHFKIIAGTHFAVDAFSYGDIPNVKHYFLTHFHSDHYTGLRKSFNKFLYCSKITANLCISRLGVNPKCIHIINVDETKTINGVEITAVEANHCPGALMLVFTLSNGKSLLHTGDFRANPAMESYPVFWNKDIHTIYIDTTYCNPRYDFPSQEQSVDMAVDILLSKKVALEKAGKQFSSVLIVCGTYTIGKEKFFLGVGRRVGGAVWACPEKARVLCAAGVQLARSPRAAQLHVLPMKDISWETLRSYLNSLKDVFSEVVAFKPSGWESGKNTSVDKDNVTIHGIPYSEHSSFSELVRFVKYLQPKQVIPTVNISGGIKSVQKYFPCPLVTKEEIQSQARLSDYFNVQTKQVT